MCQAVNSRGGTTPPKVLSLCKSYQNVMCRICFTLSWLYVYTGYNFSRNGGSKWKLFTEIWTAFNNIVLGYFKTLISALFRLIMLRLQRAENGDKIHFVVNFANLIVETFANCKWHRQCRDSIFSRGGAARRARETAGRRPPAGIFWASPPISTCYFLHNHNIEHLPFPLLTFF